MNERATAIEILAFDIGGTHGRCGLGNAAGECAHIVTLQRAGAEEGAAWMKRLLDAGREVARNSKRIERVAISFGGPVSPNGRILSMHVRGWENIDLAGEIKAAFGLPVHIENDANAGALGEFHFGAGRGCRFMAFFTVSTGIGGGVILDGKLYRGAHGMAAEFGQMVMHPGPGAPQYALGKSGVLEALASGPAITRDAAAMLQKSGKKVPAKFGAGDVFSAAAGGEAWAKETLETAVAHLARGIAAAICAYDVERVVLGGGVSLAGDALFIPLRAAVQKFVPHFLEGKYEVVPAALGDRAPMMGAIAASIADSAR